MSRKKAALILDPNRRTEQMAYVSERAGILHEVGGQLWVSMTEEQAERFAGQGITVQLYEEADLIELPAVVFDPAEGVPEPPADLRAAPPAAGDTAYYLVQFIAPVDPAWVHEIVNLGGSHVQDLPVNVGVFRLSAAQATEVEQLEYVSWVGLYHPAYAISFGLTGRDEPFDLASLRDLAVDPASVPSAEGENIRIRLFDDIPPETARAGVEGAATVVTETERGFVVRSDPSSVLALAKVPGVLAVEAFFAPEPKNDRSGRIMCTEQVRSFRNVDFLVNLDGSGEIVGVIDSGLDTGVLPPPGPAPAPPPIPVPEGPAPVLPPFPVDLWSRVLQITHRVTPGNPVPDNAASGGPHGTHVTGSIAGDGTGSGGRILGVAPACHVVFQGPLSGNTIRGFRDAHDAGARVHNNSWATSSSAPPCPPGSNISQSLPTNNQYVIGNTDLIDRFCFSYPESLVLFASGNEEKDVAPPGGDGTLDMNFLSEEATAKNVLTVGAIENVRRNDGNPRSHRAGDLTTPPGCPAIPPRYANPAWDTLAGGPEDAFKRSDNADEVVLFSNRGRVQASGGRIKPDLVAPGTNVMSLFSTQQPLPPVPLPEPPALSSVPRTENPLLYELMSGTSMATPQVAGAAILARRYYRARFGQLRRPLLLEQLSAIVDSPTVAPHRDGRVVAWIRRDAASGQNHIVAARYSRDWVRQGDVVKLRPDVGDHPAPVLARHGDNTLLLYRAKDNTLRLSLYDGTLASVNAFGSGGTLTLAPASRPEDSRRPSLLVRDDEAAVVWNESGTDKLLFQRYRAGNGTTIDATPKNLGEMTHSSAHPFIAHNGTHYAVVWAHVEGADHKLRMRLVDNSGAPGGAQPLTLATQAAGIRDPHLIWDGRQNRFVVVWAGPDAEIRSLFVDSAGSPIGAASAATTVPPGNTVRRPRISLHPDTGYVLLWEDDTQKSKTETDAVPKNHYDVYVTFLDNAGQPDRIPEDPTDPPVPAPAARPSRRLLRISDTPENTGGFTGLVDADGVAVVWQSNDEINSDRLGIYGLSVTPLGAFQAQVDPNTPLIDSGRYKNHTLLDHTRQNLESVSMAWAGGFYYLLRRDPASATDNLQLVRTSADGLVDTTYGANGTRDLGFGLFLRQHEMHWTGDRLICASLGDSADPDIFLLDAEGAPVEGFGILGWQSVSESGAVNAAISPQLGHLTQPDFRIVIVYGTGSPQANIRYAVLNASGGLVTAPRNLASANGTARHGWFHFVEGEARSIAAFHRQDAGSMAVFINRYTVPGVAQHTPNDVRLTTLAGDSRNAVIAPRPVDINSNQREYGAAWQYRADNTQPREIRFSRLNRDGQPRANPPAPAPPVRDVRVIFPNPPAWPPPGWPATTDAIEPQLVSTYTHQPLSNPPAGTPILQWSPGYGLAWLAQDPAGGSRTLFFTALDENGARAQLPLPPPYAPGAPRSEAAPIVQVSAPGADVKEFELIWNGRTFRLTWTETEGARLRHVQTALTRHGRRLVYDQPSSALLRATLINGATNIANTSLPNIPTPPITAANRNHGYGWGRVNLRQSLSPSPPVTFHVRDDDAVGPGRRARYRFYLPPNTRLLRATLAWTDPPNTGASIVNNLHLRIVPPGGAAASQEYHGNTWQAAPNVHLSRLVPPATPFESVHNIEQVVVQDPSSGIYEVEVIAEPFPANSFDQLRAQPFALVFVGSGPEVRFGGVAPTGPIPVY